MRFYYKKKDETAYLSLKTSDYDGDENYIRITEGEWNQHMKELEEQMNPKVEADTK